MDPRTETPHPSVPLPRLPDPDTAHLSPGQLLAQPEAGSLSSPPNGGALPATLPDPDVQRGPVAPNPRGPSSARMSSARVSGGRPPQVLSSMLQVGALALVTYLCLFNFSIVRGSSMAPRIHDGDRILIDHFSYMMAPVERGDIVVLKYPLDPTVAYIKRVIGLPGDHVVLEEGRVFVNGTPLEEPYVDDPDAYSDVDVEVLPAHYFVLGDNRRRSCDSREFGQVPGDYVRGKVDLRVWPPARFGRIDL